MRNGADQEEVQGAYLTELAEAGVLGVSNGIAEGSEVDVGVIAHLPILMLQSLIPWQLFRLLEKLLVLRRHGRPPPSWAGSAERPDATNSRVIESPPHRADAAA